MESFWVTDFLGDLKRWRHWEEEVNVYNLMCMGLKVIGG
jgi:hypothetical protein